MTCGDLPVGLDVEEIGEEMGSSGPRRCYRRCAARLRAT